MPLIRAGPRSANPVGAREIDGGKARQGAGTVRGDTRGPAGGSGVGTFRPLQTVVLTHEKAADNVSYVKLL